MKSPFDLSEEVVAVTGGAGLLGMAFARAILSANGSVIVADVMDPEEAKQRAIQTGIDVNSDRIVFVTVDITEEQTIDEMVGFAQDTFGSITALVNNAYPRNSNYGRKFFDVTFKDFSENLSGNLGGYFLASKVLASHFRQKQRGTIINIASIYGVVPPRFEIYDDTEMTMPVEYAAIKSAVIHLTKYMAKLLLTDSIRVNCISPGGIADQQPKSFQSAYGRHTMSQSMLDQNDISGALIFLLSSAASNITGHNIVVDDGFVL